MNTLTLGSLFDGSGGFPLAGTLCGITPVWAAEVEPYPIAVTKSRFPDMMHLGSVTDIDGGKIAPVDIISFGSPCQDMSVAGKRSGIEGSRSNMFFEAIRIIKEMRNATNNEYPKYIIWENVPGAFSSNNGHDFHTVLTEICSVCDSAVSISRPYDPKRPDKLLWNGAGQIVGSSYSLAWRTLDAQYWGVPQRRKRIYLVADFTSRRAGEILFEQDGLRGDMSQGFKAGQGVTTDVMGGVDGSVGVECLACSGKQQSLVTTEECANTIGANDWKEPQSVVFSFDSLSSNSMKSSNHFSGCREVEIAKCIDTTYPDPSKNQGGIAVVQEVIAMATQQGGAEIAENLCPTITAAAGMSGNNQPVIAIQAKQQGMATIEKSAGFKELNGAKAYGNAYEEEKAPTLTSGKVDASVVIALQANGIDRADTAGCNGCGWRENESYTLNTVDRHAVCFDRAAFNQGINAQYDFEVSQNGINSTVVAKGPGGVCYGIGNGQANNTDIHDKIGALNCMHDQQAVIYDARGNGEGDTLIFEPRSPDGEPRVYDNIVPTLNTAQGGQRQPCIVTDYTAVAVQETKGEKECAYGTKTETNTDKILQALWEEVGAKKVAEWGFRILISFQQKGVLRPCLHGKSVSDGGNGVNKVDSPAPNEPQEKAERELRGVRSEKCARRTPQRWEPSEQQLGEFTTHLQELSQQDSSVEGVLCHMWKANERAWLLRKALSEIQKAREPICNKNQSIQRRYIIRRLLPVECARLQGFPGCWADLAPYNPDDAEFWEQVRKTHAEIYGKVYKPCKNLEAWYNKLHTDSAEYKMWGNGIALPNALYVLEGIAIHNNFIAG